MKRGRKSNSPQLEFLKNPPPHILEAKETPAGMMKLAETKAMVKRMNNEWRELRRKGVTQDYFELMEITDPELMGPIKVLPYEKAKLIDRYAASINNIVVATARNAAAQKSGADATRTVAESNIRWLRERFSDVIELFLAGSFTAEHAARCILKKIKNSKDPLDAAWDGNHDTPSSRTLRTILRNLAKATHQ